MRKQEHMGKLSMREKILSWFREYGKDGDVYKLSHRLVDIADNSIANQTQRDTVDAAILEAHITHLLGRVASLPELTAGLLTGDEYIDRKTSLFDTIGAHFEGNKLARGSPLTLSVIKRCLEEDELPPRARENAEIILTTCELEGKHGDTSRRRRRPAKLTVHSRSYTRAVTIG